MNLIDKIKYKKTIAIIASIIVLLIIFYFSLAAKTYDPERETKFGVTFSKIFAEYWGLDWRETYIAILDELKVKYIRIPTYWADIEPEQDQYDYDDIDWQVNEANKRGVKVILVVGRRQPRWPECHDPEWLSSLSSAEAKERVLENIETTVNRYKNNSAVEIWQVENEAFLDFFGECPKIKKKELQAEIDLVKSLDQRPILMTDSGELSTWYPLGLMGDYFGTTLYRTTYNKYIGFWEYWFVPPSFYRVKAAALGRQPDQMFIAELQAEPWFKGDPLSATLSEHFKIMDAEKLKANADYARQANVARVYFWGVEWWYWAKAKHGDSSMWEAAKEYF